jgi:hypothetical protein
MLTEIQKIALAKTEFDRSGVPSGVHNVDFTVRIRGQVKVGNDYDRPATTSVPWLEATTLYREAFKVTVEELIRKVESGETVTREDLVAITEVGPLSSKVLVDCFRKAMTLGESAVSTVKDKVEIDEAICRLKEEIVAPLPRQNVPGRVKVDVEITEGTTTKEAAADFNPQVRQAV